MAHGIAIGSIVWLGALACSSDGGSRAGDMGTGGAPMDAGAGGTGAAAAMGGAGAAGGASGAGGSAGAGGTGGTGASGGNAGTGASGGNAGTGASGGTGGAGGEPASAGPCPAEPPIDAAPCDAETRCSYGDHPLSQCRTIAECNEADRGRRWTVATRTCELDARCPSTPGGRCDAGETSGVSCIYTDGTTCAGCFPCADACAPGSRCPPCGGEPEGTPVWDCTAAPVTRPGCPPLIPNAGSPCDLEEGTACYFSVCPYGVIGVMHLSVECWEGTWRWLDSECPFVPPPVCAAPDTPIATPTGDRPIASLAVGDLVYSADEWGVRVVPIREVTRTPVTGHRVVRVELANHQVLRISGGHPTADGRHFSDLTAGDRLDGVAVLDARWVDYREPFTYDILPSKEGGTYYAGGVLIGSTLR